MRRSDVTAFWRRTRFLEIEAYGDRVTISSHSGVSASGAPILETRQFESTDPLRQLRQRIESVRAATLPELPPFCSGAVGYAGYDIVRYVEHLPNPPKDDRRVPDLAFAFYDQMVVFDNVTKTIVVVAMARIKEAKGDLRKAYREACRRVDAIVDELHARPCDLGPVDIETQSEVRIEYTSNFTREDFEAAVRKGVEYIKAGDIFQVVFSQRLEVPIRSHPFQIYRMLRVVNPSPFMFYVRMPSVTLVGSSPEIMVRVVRDDALAGTRPRGKTDEEDRLLAEELLADPKERAEHVMLVDLGRNDVGRVSRVPHGEPHRCNDNRSGYSHVMHITSNVPGTPGRRGRPPSTRPSGVPPRRPVSGSPKVRAMQIIDDGAPSGEAPMAERWVTSTLTATWTPASPCGQS